MIALLGSIGTEADFLEIDLKGGALSARAQLGVYITETDGDLAVNIVYSATSDVTLTADTGSITDALPRSGGNAALQTIINALWPTAAPLTAGPNLANVTAIDIDLNTPVGGIGSTGASLLINSGTAGAGSGHLYADGFTGVYLMEVDDELRVLAARSATGSVRLVVLDSGGPRAPPFGDDLILLTTGTALVVQGAPQEVRPSSEWTTGRTWAGIWAKVDIDLYAGDDVIAPTGSEIVAGGNIRIFGDQGPAGTSADPGVGTVMTFAGRVGGDFFPCCDVSAPGAPAADPTELTEIFGNADADTFNFTSTFLGAKTRVYGSASRTTQAAADSADTFVVFELQTMAVALGHTLTLDGQQQGDTYRVTTTAARA